MEQNNQSSTKNWVLGGIIAVLIGLCGYLFINKNKAEQLSQKTGTELLETSQAKETLQTDFNEALGRLDQLKSENLKMDSLVGSQDAELIELKNKITSILQNKNATASELNSAKEMIEKLNKTVDGFQKQITQLKESNANLATEKEKLTSEKTKLNEEKTTLTSEKTKLSEEKTSLTGKNEELETKITLAKILSASNIELTPIKKRFLTGKEAETAKAKRAKLIRIQFNLNDNRLSESGEKQLYIIVYAPNGDAYNAGQFKLNNGTEKIYSVAKTVPYIQGQTTKNISLDWVPNDDNFDAGEYNVEIYHNGYKIGGNYVSLK